MDVGTCVCLCWELCVHVRVGAGSSMCPHQAQEVMMKGSGATPGWMVGGGSDPAPRRVSLEEEGIKSVCLMRKHSDLLCICAHK